MQDLIHNSILVAVCDHLIHFNPFNTKMMIIEHFIQHHLIHLIPFNPFKDGASGGPGDCEALFASDIQDCSGVVLQKASNHLQMQSRPLQRCTIIGTLWKLPISWPKTGSTGNRVVILKYVNSFKTGPNETNPFWLVLAYS